MSKFIKTFKETGPCEINIEMVIRKWNRLWCISQWRDEFTLVKYLRKDSPIKLLKAKMEPQEAEILISILELERTQSGIFRSGASWRKPEHNE